MINKCKNLKYRSKQYIKYTYCTVYKKSVTLEECRNCSFKEYKEIKPIKKRSYKITKAEKNRYSILTDDLDTCIECFKPKEHLHEIFYGKNRQQSIHYGCVIPLCSSCHRKIHSNPSLRLKWQIKAQIKWELLYGSTDDFIDKFGKNYKI